MKTILLFKSSLVVFFLFISFSVFAIIEIETTKCICEDGLKGSITLKIEGEDAEGQLASPFTFEWSGPDGYTSSDQNAGSITTPGIYTVVVTNAYGCESTLSTEVTICEGISQIQLIATNTCSGDLDGSIQLTVVGGLEPYSYYWSNNESTSNISNLSGGTYEVTVTDANGCTITDEETIIEYSVPELDGEVTLSSCAEISDGSILLNITGGVPPYQIAWDNEATTQTISNLTGAEYCVTVTDANGCSVSDCYSTLPLEPQVEMPYIKKVQVYAEAGVVQDLIYNGEWTLGTDGKVCFSGGMQDISEVLFEEIKNGLRSFRIEAFSNKEISSLKLAIPNVLDNFLFFEIDHWAIFIDPFIVSGSLISDGVLHADLIFTGQDLLSPPTDLLDLRLVTMDMENCVPIPELMPDCTWQPFFPTGQDDVHVLDWGCPDLNLEVVSMSVTSGNCDGSISLSFDSENAPFMFSVTNNGNVISTQGNSQTSTFSGLCAGNYTVTASDSESCSETMQVTISVCSDLEIASPEILNAQSCDTGDGSIDFGIIEPTGGEAPYQFEWSTGQTGKIIENLSPGTYSVTLTDSKGCLQEFSYSVGLENISGFIFEIEEIIVQDDENGDCEGSIFVNVNYNGSPLDLILRLTGNGQNIYLELSPPYTYTFEDLCAGDYTLNVLYNHPANKCSIITEVTINSCPGFVLSGSPNITKPGSCESSDGVISFPEPNPIGGTSPYQWEWSSGSNIPYQISGLLPDIYSLTITDANGCTIEKTFDLTIPNDVSLVQITNIFPSTSGCNGSIEITGVSGVSLYLVGEFIALTVNMEGDSYTFEGLCNDLYFITATDINGCETSFQAQVIKCPDLEIPIPKIYNPSSCNSSDGVIHFFTGISGGEAPYTWTWNPVISEFMNNLSAGIYYLTVTDVLGCTAEASYELISQGTPVITYGSNPACEGVANGEAYAFAETEGGNSTYSYLWDNGSTEEELLNVNAGQYCLTITVNETNCSSSVCMDVEEILSTGIFQVESFSSTPSCVDQHTGAISLNITGGNPPYVVNWNNGMAGENINKLMGGFYQAVITDDCNRQIIQYVYVDIYPEMELSVVPVSGCAGEGILDLMVLGGTSPFSFLWSNGMTSEDLEQLNDGEEFCVTVTDANGCFKSICGIAENYPPIVISSDVQTSCDNGLSRSIVLSVSAGASPYSYLWNTGATTKDVFSLEAGNYSVTVTDGNGCTASHNIEVMPCSASTFSLIELGIEYGSNSVFTVGGTPPFSYYWSGPNGFTSNSFSPSWNSLPSGIYNVTVFDACCNSASLNITHLRCSEIDFSLAFDDPCGGVFDGVSGPYIIDLSVSNQFIIDEATVKVQWTKNGNNKESGINKSSRGAIAPSVEDSVALKPGCKQKVCIYHGYFQG